MSGSCMGVIAGTHDVAVLEEVGGVLGAVYSAGLGGTRPFAWSRQNVEEPECPALSAMAFVKKGTALPDVGPFRFFYGGLRPISVPTEK